ncbi:DUF6339 family protein [Oribacterium sp. C9]|uniref:DUF6339 family protein n=1 Tax=Oribacterium sp. C9 TaxID=1943579 RepID=UPI001FA82034|nr:DUF6339 family protein [Oribacterium sp. C9]
MYLDSKAIDDLKINFSFYKNHFTDESNDWFIRYFNQNGWLHESKIQCKDFELNYDNDYNVSDRKNVEIVYEAMKDLSPANALDERLWAGILFAQLWEYVKFRRKEELMSNDARDVLNSFIFLRGTKRSCFINCLSRLWWTGHLLYDKHSNNHYAAVDLISESAFASNVMLLSSNNFMANNSLALGIMDCIAERKNKGEKIGRYHFVEANKYLNCVGGVILLDTMTREEVKNMTNSRLDKLYGLIK